LFFLGFLVHSPQVLLVSSVILLGIFSIAGGVAVVPFSVIIPRTIPKTARGSLFGMRQLIGGILAARQILADEKLQFPVNYSIPFAASSLLLVAVYASLCMVREPPTLSTSFSERRSLVDEALGALRPYPAMLHLVAVHVLGERHGPVHSLLHDIRDGGCRASVLLV